MNLDTTPSTTLRYRRNNKKVLSPRSLRLQKRREREEEIGNVSTDLAGTSTTTISLSNNQSFEQTINHLNNSTGTDGSVTEITDDESISKTVSTVNSAQDKENKMDKMLRRTKLAFFMLFLFCVIVSLGHIWVVITVWILQALAFNELTNLRYKDAKEIALPYFRTFHWCLFVSATMFSKGRAVLQFCINTPFVFQYGFKGRLEIYRWMLDNWDYITFNMYAGLFVIFVLSLKKGYYKYQFGQLTWTVFSLAITMVQANGISENIMEGFFWFIFPAMLIACNDTMA